MHKLLLLLLTSISGLALGQDSNFDREFSRFDKDFERLNKWKAETPASKKLKRAPASAPAKAVEQGVTPLDDNSQKVPVAEDADANDKPAASTSEDAATSAPAKTSALQKSLPKGAKVEKLARNDLLGHQISDPVMSKKIQDLYNRQDVVVQQYILPTN